MAYCNHWTGLDWTGLDWTGLDWTGLDWTLTIFQFKPFFQFIMLTKIFSVPENYDCE